MPFADQHPDLSGHALPYEIGEYLGLVDWSDRAVVEGKRGSVPEGLPLILALLKIDSENDLRLIKRKKDSRLITPVEAIRDLAAQFGKSFPRRQAAAAMFFRPGCPGLLPDS